MNTLDGLTPVLCDRCGSEWLVLYSHKIVCSDCFHTVNLENLEQEGDHVQAGR